MTIEKNWVVIIIGIVGLVMIWNYSYAPDSMVTIPIRITGSLVWIVAGLLLCNISFRPPNEPPSMPST